MGAHRRLDTVAAHVVQPHLVAAEAIDAAQPDSGRALTDEEKRQLFEIGFIIVRNAVPAEVIADASARIHADIQAKKEASQELKFGENPVFARTVDKDEKPSALSASQIQDRGELASLAAAPELVDMISKSSLTPILADLLGHTDRNTETGGVQPAITPVRSTEPDTPLTPTHKFSQGLHVDGRRPNANADGFLFIDAAETVCVRPFQCICFVACSDQTEPGQGQTHVMPGGHFAMEEFFRWQQENHGRLGSKQYEDGSFAPGWGGPEGQGIPTAVKETLLSMADYTTSVVGKDGVRVLLPTAVRLRKGDACIAAYHLPHTASANEAGPIREQVIFRFGLPGTGNGTDLPQWEVESWRQQLCHQWTGFPGMEGVIEESPRLTQMRTELRRRLADE